MSEVAPDPALGAFARSPRQQAHDGYRAMLRMVDGQPAEARALMRRLCQEDLFFLLVYVLNRSDLDRDWLFARIKEVQASPDGHIDLWAREHGKSSIITFGLTIQDVLRDAEVTIGIFSRSRPQAKAFLRQIKNEFENNQVLKDLFPDVLFPDPVKQSPLWSLDDGIVVRRKGNTKEATIEAWGLVDGQPTGRHFKKMIYDDVVDQSGVTSEDMIKTVNDALELSTSLSTVGGIMRMVGTFYHHADSYRHAINKGMAVARIHPATHNGEEDGTPVLFPPAEWEKRRKSNSAYNLACQYLLNPTKGTSRSFDTAWLRHWNRESTRGLNIYVVVDAANSKKKRADFTTMWVIGLGRDKNYYVIDCVRDRMDLGQRARALFKLVGDYQPIKVGYEEIGLMADIAHLKSQQDLLNFHFEIQPLGGNIAKADRIEWLIPVCKQNRLYLPYRIMYETAPPDRQRLDLVQIFINQEYAQWPLPTHDDMLDALARIEDPLLRVEWPLGLMHGGMSTTANAGTAAVDYDVLGR